jgi:hypothetical protein
MRNTLIIAGLCFAVVTLTLGLVFALDVFITVRRTRRNRRNRRK